MSPRRLQHDEPKDAYMEANNIPRFEEVTDGAREREKHEHACCCYISPSQEWVLATYPGNRGDYK